MASLRKSKSGSYIARGRVPADVRDEYGRLYGKSHEVKFSAPATTKPSDAKRLYAEWLAEHEARVAAIRAERDGSGRSLSHRQAVHLAADWYRWFIARHMEEPGAEYSWEIREDIIRGTLREFVPEGNLERATETEVAIQSLLPRIADDAETQQFLAHHGVTLSREGQQAFVRALFDEYLAAIRRLELNARGKYPPDTHAAKLPHPFERDTRESPWELFEAWVEARQPAQGTVENWQYMLQNLTDHFPGRSAGSLTEADGREWLTGLIGPERKTRTVYKTWKRAAQTVFQWALDQKRLSGNLFANIKAPRTPKSDRSRQRSDKHFRSAELSTILGAALAVQSTTKPDDAAKRWVPWLLAYSGARPGEITQLRGTDVRNDHGLPVLHLTPDAGTIKSQEAREVPLHEHLIAQGFLDWVQERGDGPLFYAPRKRSPQRTKSKTRKHPAAQARQRLAEWVRSIGVTDPHLSPNHAWRHTFKVHGRRIGISEKHLDDICGHAAPSEGRRYGPTPIEDKAAAIARFPRYVIEVPKQG